MTNLEALKAKLGYPISDNTAELALTLRGLTITDTFTAGSQAFDLAYADSIITILTSPTSVSEGGYSISYSDRASLLSIANYLYARYGAANPLETLRPKARFVHRW